MVFLEKKHDFVEVKLNGRSHETPKVPQKALQIRLDQNKTAVIYNRINNYILDAFLKAAFDHDAWFK